MSSSNNNTSSSNVTFSNTEGTTKNGGNYNNSNNSICNVINTPAFQSLLHNIPFVGLMSASVQQPVCELAGMSSLTSTIVPPNFNNIGVATGTNLTSVIGTNNFVLIGCRESTSCDEVQHASKRTLIPYSH